MESRDIEIFLTLAEELHFGRTAAAPDGTPTRAGPVVKTFHEVLHTVATRQALAPLGSHYARYYSHPGIVLLPVEDAPITEWALFWRSGDLSPRASAFVDVAAQRGPRVFDPS
ncbi:hypothetical protein [Catellatospora sp. NPDC049133]|uniref:hypothetical protein n=1 Tax=Catellatospora sp. NPDC049133 TaxID=3155499 RepID=UPI00340CEF32